ncbi:MAG: hypothetical protein L7S56_02560 [Candidatus Poseidonia sp.]|nr:hypothetical protein [Poseidonia sp.]
MSSSRYSELFRQQGFQLLMRLGFEIDQTSTMSNPLQFLLPKISAKSQEVLSEDEEWYRDVILPYKTETANISKPPQEYAQALVEEMRGTDWQNTAESINFHIIHGSAGRGKSVYLAAVFEALRRRSMEQGDDSFPVIHSNLKHSKLLNRREFTENVIFHGIPLEDILPNQSISNFNELGKHLQSPTEGVLLIIDSLDEFLTTGYAFNEVNYQKREKEIRQVNRSLRKKGFLPVWSCRSKDFFELELGEDSDEGQDLTLKEKLVPKIEVNDLAEVCLVKDNDDKDSNPLFNALRSHALGGELGDSDDSHEKFITWLERSIELNPLFCYFRIFCKIPPLRAKLTQDMVEIMFEEFDNFSKQGKEAGIYQDSKFQQWQNKFVVSDFVIRALVKFFREQKEFTSTFHFLQKLTEGHQSKLKGKDTKNIEIISDVMERVQLEFKTEEEMKEGDLHPSEILEAFGLTFSPSSEEKYMWRHRAFAEFFAIVDSKTLMDVDVQALTDLRERELWKWRHFIPTPMEVSGKYAHLLNSMYERTGGFALSNPTLFDERFSLYIQEMKKRNSSLADLVLRPEGPQQPKKGALSKGQQQIIFDAFKADEHIQISGWPGVGKTYAGTHYLLANLVNQFVRSPKPIYDHNNEAKGLIVTLNPMLSQFIKDDLAQYNTPDADWKNLANAKNKEVEWSELKQSVLTLSMEEIIQKLDEGNPRARVLKLMDLKEVHDEYWVKFNKNNPKSDYTWKEASKDFQKHFFTPLGEWVSDLDTILVSTPGDGGKWWEYLQSREFGTSHHLTIQSACIKLIHRFILAHDVYDLPGDLDVNQIKLDLTNDKREVDEILEDFRKNDFSKYISVTLVDEVQDLPFEACVLLGLLSRGAGRSSVIFAGDENQVLNQSDFKWDKFRDDYAAFIKNLSNHYGKGNLRRESYLITYQDPRRVKEAPADKKAEPLNEIWRNTKSIVETWKRAGSWSPSPTDQAPPIPNIEKATAVESLITPDVTFIFVGDKYPGGDYGGRNALRHLRQILSDKVGVALIQMSGMVEHLYKAEEGHKTELYSTHTIKGLERDTAILTGALLFETFNIPKLPDDINDERMRLLVGMSRGKRNLLVLCPKPQSAGGQGVWWEGHQGEQFSLDHFIDEAYARTVEIQSREELKKLIEDIVRAKEGTESLVAIEELIKSRAYESDQLDLTKERVKGILMNLREKKTDLFFKWCLEDLKWNTSEPFPLPIFIDQFLLHEPNGDGELGNVSAFRQSTKYSDSTDVGNAIHEYHSWKESSPLTQLLERHSLLNNLEKSAESFMIRSGFFDNEEDEENWMPVFNKLISRVQGGLRSLMMFADYLYGVESTLPHKEKQSVAIAYYLAKEPNGGSKQSAHQAITDLVAPVAGEDLTFATEIRSILESLPGTPNEYDVVFGKKMRLEISDRQRFSQNVLKLIQTLKSATLNLSNDHRKSKNAMEDFVVNFPPSSIKYLSQSLILEVLGLFLHDKFLVDNKKYSPWLRVYLSKERWDSSRFQSKGEFAHSPRLTSQQFKKLYQSSKGQFHLNQGFGHLPFVYQQHIWNDVLTQIRRPMDFEHFTDYFKQQIGHALEQSSLRPYMKNQDLVSYRFGHISGDEYNTDGMQTLQSSIEDFLEIWAKENAKYTNYLKPRQRTRDDVEEVYDDNLAGKIETHRSFTKMLRYLIEQYLFLNSDAYLREEVDPIIRISSPEAFKDAKQLLLDAITQGVFEDTDGSDIEPEGLEEKLLRTIDGLLHRGSFTTKRQIKEVVYTWATLRFLTDDEDIRKALSIDVDFNQQMMNLSQQYPFLMPKGPLNISLYTDWDHRTIYTPPENEYQREFISLWEKELNYIESTKQDNIKSIERASNQYAPKLKSESPWMPFKPIPTLTAVDWDDSSSHRMAKVWLIPISLRDKFENLYLRWHEYYGAQNESRALEDGDGTIWGQILSRGRIEFLDEFYQAIRDATINKIESSKNYFEIKTLVSTINKKFGKKKGHWSPIYFDLPAEIKKAINTKEVQSLVNAQAKVLESNAPVSEKTGSSKEQMKAWKAEAENSEIVISKQVELAFSNNLLIQITKGLSMMGITSKAGRVNTGTGSMTVAQKSKLLKNLREWKKAL